MHPVCARRSATILLLVTAIVAGASLLAGAQRIETSQLQRDGRYRLLLLQPGSTDLMLSRDGSQASIVSVTFDMQRGVPQRLVLVSDLRSARVIWRLALPSANCCAFPVLAATPLGDAIAVGGGEETIVYTREGSPVFPAGLGDGRLHSALDISDDGGLVVVGEWEGRVAAFRRGQTTPRWVKDTVQDLMVVALSGNGEVAIAAFRDRVLLVRTRDGVTIAEQSYGPTPIAALAISRDGRRAALVWKRRDEQMTVGFFQDGRMLWTRTLGKGTVPLLQIDEAGRWLAVGDLLGVQAALLSAKGDVQWRSHGQGRAAVAVSPDGSRAAFAGGTTIRVTALPAGRTIWQDRLPGPAHLMRLAGPRLAVLGALKEGLPDRVWFTRLPAR